MRGYAILLLTALVAISSRADAKGVCAGCPVHQDVSGFPMNKLHRALATANANEGVNKIISVTTQVVAGIKYNVVYESASGKVCTATWIEAEWESKLPLGTQISCKAKRSLLGGFTDVDSSEIPTVQAYGDLASNQNTHNGASTRRVVVKVLKAQKQVVNGVNYKFKYVVKTTACSMDETPNDDCMNKEVAPREVCESLVYTNNFLVHDVPRVQVLHTECHTDDSATSFLALPGGLANGKDSQEMHDAAQFATKYINKKVNSMYLKGLYKINKVQQQVVAGTLYHFTIVLRATDCLKQNGVVHPTENCNFSAQPAERDLECDINVWVKPWLGFRQVTESNCHSL
ncbi:Curly [Nesidiocoris tenuis]|uniref:Curly n=1 Tax=Nesidiocoris tenuis TaxID=355587 RepID=A0ABN7BAN7_9HEMI|nr:Curly [Nesidiocoris tenuis]